MSQIAPLVRTIRQALRADPLLQKSSARAAYGGAATQEDFNLAWERASERAAPPVRIGPKMEDKLRAALQAECSACALDDQQDFNKVIRTVMKTLKGRN